MVTFALDEAEKVMGSDFAGKTALVLGAGAMSSLAATQLGKRGVRKLIIANRTRSRAERLAEHAREAGVAAEVVDFNARTGALSRADITVSATASDGFTITADDLSGPAVLVDLSLPRDIADDVTQRDGIHLINIEYLHTTRGGVDSEDSLALRQAQAIVAEEVETFSSQQRVRDIAPAVARLRRTAGEVQDFELQRLRTKLPDLSEEDFDQVTRTVKRVVDKLLHTPTVKIKELAATSEQVSVETVIEELFGLGRSSVAIDAQRLPRPEELQLKEHM